MMERDVMDYIYGCGCNCNKKTPKRLEGELVGSKKRNSDVRVIPMKNRGEPKGKNFLR